MTPEQLTAVMDAEWLHHVKGSWSESDKRIFAAGFYAGWRGRREHSLRQLPQSYSGITVSCWLCHSEHLTGVKWCPVMVKIV